MSLRFFGAGGAFSRRYGTTCSGLTVRDGMVWLIDCGRQAPDQLHAAGVSWHEIHGQIITHVHGDHIFGLEDFAFSRYFHRDAGVEPVHEGGPRPKYVSHSAVRDEVWQTMASALRYVPDPLAPTSGSLETYFDLVDPTSAEPPGAGPWPHAERFVSGALDLVTRETVHVPAKPSTSLEIALGDGRIAWWSGDTTVDPEGLARLEPKTSVFFHDCTFIESPGQVHGSFEALAALPPTIRRKIVLMHHEDDVEDHRARAEAAEFRLAMPGDVFDLDAGALRS